MKHFYDAPCFLFLIALQVSSLVLLTIFGTLKHTTLSSVSLVAFEMQFLNILAWFFFLVKKVSYSFLCH